MCRDNRKYVVGLIIYRPTTTSKFLFLSVRYDRYLFCDGSLPARTPPCKRCAGRLTAEYDNTVSVRMEEELGPPVHKFCSITHSLRLWGQPVGRVLSPDLGLSCDHIRPVLYQVKVTSTEILDSWRFEVEMSTSQHEMSTSQNEMSTLQVEISFSSTSRLQKLLKSRYRSGTRHFDFAVEIPSWK